MKKTYNFIKEHLAVPALLTAVIGGTLTHFVEDPQIAIAMGGTASACVGAVVEAIREFTDTNDAFSPLRLGKWMLGSLVGLGASIIPFV